MNFIEKILAKHGGKKEVAPGDIISAKPDYIMVNELSGIGAIAEFEKVGAKKVFDPDKLIVVPSHFTPAKDIRTAEVCKTLREFVRAQGIQLYFEVGRGGIEHVVLPDEGLVRPGELIIGGDSHTVTYGALGNFGCGVGSTDIAAAWITGEIWLRVPETMKIVFSGKPGPWTFAKDLILYAIKHTTVEGARYKAVEYAGGTVRSMPMVGRLTMSNMAAEMGGKVGMIEPDETTAAFLNGTPARGRKFDMVKSDPDAKYCKTIELDVDGLPPQVSIPYAPDQVKNVDDVEGVKLDQVFIGSCTNGRIEDLRLAASILKGKRVHDRVRLLVIPGSQRVYIQAANEGLLGLFAEAGAAVSTPTCGACVGGHMGILAGGEACLSTTNRNFVGRMGHANAKVYLANPAVAAASALAGEIVNPAPKRAMAGVC